jgi:dTDP-glucose 4,6-dehydratase
VGERNSDHEFRETIRHSRRERFFNAYGPGEHYHNYRSVVCLFAYRALHRLPYDVYMGYHRVFMYIDDFIPTLANVVNNFVPGEVYNIGGDEFRSVKEMSDLVLKHLELDDSLVNYLPEDKHNVVNKRPNIEKAKSAFGHSPKVTLEQGIPLTVDWMQKTYADSARIR